MVADTMQVDTPSLTDGAFVVRVVKIAVPCTGCRRHTKIRVNGEPGHYGCIARRGGRPVPDEPDREPAPEEQSMFGLLQESIAAARKRPVLRVSADARASEPWGLITETLRGEHRFRITDTGGHDVKVLDRNGSYPAAMGSVPVAVGLLEHTGPIDYSTAHAGIYQIPRFGWPAGLPHPLGEIADDPGELWWVATPHLRLCIRLAAHKRSPAPRIVDSFAAASATTLFKRFSDGVFESRAASRHDPDAYAEIKRKSSIAIRALWPKASKSPFWRPDWSVSVRAEAAVRHWVRADQAIAAGARLVKLGSVDEAAFLIPPRARATWVPEPYVIGDGIGYVKVKSTMTADQWKRARR